MGDLNITTAREIRNGEKDLFLRAVRKECFLCSETNAPKVLIDAHEEREELFEHELTSVQSEKINFDEQEQSGAKLPNAKLTCELRGAKRRRSESS